MMKIGHVGQMRRVLLDLIYESENRKNVYKFDG